MAVKTVTQDDFMIFRKVQKETRRSCKEVLLNSNQAGLRLIEKRPTLQSIFRGVCSNGNKWQVSILNVKPLLDNGTRERLQVLFR